MSNLPERPSRNPEESLLLSLEGLLAEYEDAQKQPMGRTSYVRNDFANDFGDICWSHQDEIIAALRSAATSSETERSDLALLKMALGNTAACLGDVLAIYNKVVGEQVFKNAAPQANASPMPGSSSGLVLGDNPAAAAPEVPTSAERPQSK